MDGDKIVPLPDKFCIEVASGKIYRILTRLLESIPVKIMVKNRLYPVENFL